MRSTALLALAVCLSSAVAGSAAAQEAKSAEPPRPAPEVTSLQREIGKLRSEVAALSKQVDELKKGQAEMRSQVSLLQKHRHQLFLDFLRADAFFPQAKGTFFVTTPSPDTLTKTSGPVAGAQ
jgi:cell division protein FtsB